MSTINRTCCSKIWICLLWKYALCAHRKHLNAKKWQKWPVEQIFWFASLWWVCARRAYQRSRSPVQWTCIKVALFAQRGASRGCVHREVVSAAGRDGALCVTKDTPISGGDTCWTQKARDLSIYVMQFVDMRFVVRCERPDTDAA